MNERMEDLLYQAGLTSQGCWDELGTYEQEAIEKLTELIVRECAKYVDVMWPHQKEFKGTLDVGKGLKAKFGVEE